MQETCLGSSQQVNKSNTEDKRDEKKKDPLMT